MYRKYGFLLLLAILTVSIVFDYTFVANAQEETLDPPDSPLAEPEVSPVPELPEEQLAKVVQYIAGQQQIPESDLQVIGQDPVHFEYLNRTYYYVVAAKSQIDPSSESAQHFAVFVDSETGAIEPSVIAIRQAEDAARIAKYGKLHPHLYDRVQTAEVDEKIPVSIWVTYTEHGRQPGELAAEVAQIYPEAAVALQERGAPWAVEDPELASVIQSAYLERLQASVSRRVDPLISWLAELGLEVSRDEPTVPVIRMSLTKEQLDKVAAHSLVERVYLDEVESVPASDIATATSRIPYVWQQPGGIDGSGIDVAVLETGPDRTGTNINATADACLDIAGTFDASNPEGVHQSRVAAIIACNDSTRPGVARGARIFDAGYDPDIRTFLQAMTYARDNADIINISMSLYPLNDHSSPAILVEDRIVDYYVRYFFDTVVVAAGNNPRVDGGPPAPNVASPGKGWNSISVGNVNDRNSAHWASLASGTQDVVYATSSYINPSTGAEKPDLAAPGTLINTVAGEGTGTSFATPQVSGVAALLMERDNQLINRPEAIRAILMASAVHNVRDSRVMPAGQDLRDGAGAINAKQADITASLRGGTGGVSPITCDRPCWWTTDTVNFARAAQVQRTFQAVQGERIRVAIAWFSVVDYFYASDTLDVNFNLAVYDRDGLLVPGGYSASWNNSQELVEFVAPKTGNYTIVAIRYDDPNSTADDQTIQNEVGLAWTKQATYLPDVRGNNNGWTSSISIRNDGAIGRPVQVTFLNSNGTTHSTQSYNSGGNLASNAVWSVTPPSGFWGSAVVDGNEDLSVAVVHERSSPNEVATYTGIGAGESDIHVPILQRNNSGWKSDLFIQNVSGKNVQVDAWLHPVPGKGNACKMLDNASINAGGWLRIDMSSGTASCAGSIFVGSALIASDDEEPLAVSSTQYNSSSMMVTDNWRGTSDPVYAPLIQNGNNGWNAGLTLQNVYGGSSTMNARFWRNDGGNSCNNTSGSIGAWYPWVLFPLPCSPGSTIASADLSNNGPATAYTNANVNQIRDSSANASTYSAVIPNYSKAVVVPRIWRQSPWGDAISVRNLSGNSQTITVYSYSSSGSLLTTTTHSVSGNGLTTVAPGNTSTRSVVVTSQYPIVVTVNNFEAGAGGDEIGSTSPVHR